jgi:RimJ/RimL family protein N-acetyltransferase
MQPVLHTERLTLRPFVRADVTRLVSLAGDRRVADTMISVPHPYTIEYALRWVEQCGTEFDEGRAVHFAVGLKEAADDLVGHVALRDIDREHHQAELSFWIGEAHTGRGFAVEAARAVLEYGFRALQLNRVCAYHMVRNEASGRVLDKLRMQREGLLRERVYKWQRFEDVRLWAVLRRDWPG